MTVSNILTVSRMILAPVFVALLLLCQATPGGQATIIILLWTVYLVIELSDLADGFFARLLHQETELGKVLDPFADSVSRLSCFLGFMIVGLMPWWMFLIAFYRDLWVSFLRLNLAKKGRVQGARVSGKIKAWVYAISNVLALSAFSTERVLPNPAVYDMLKTVSLIGFSCVAVVALWSGIDYSTMLWNGKNSQKK